MRVRWLELVSAAIVAAAVLVSVPATFDRHSKMRPHAPLPPPETSATDRSEK